MKTSSSLLLHSFCFAVFAFKFSWNVLLINSDNHKLPKAHNSDKKICLEALFSLSFRREGLTELEGIPGWRPEMISTTFTSFSSKRQLFVCLPICFLLPFPSGEGTASAAAFGRPPQQARYDRPHLTHRGSQPTGFQPVMFNSRTLLHNHSSGLQPGAVSSCGT